MGPRSLLGEPHLKAPHSTCSIGSVYSPLFPLRTPYP